MIGSVAVWVDSAAHRRGEFGYVFHPRHWGRGYATEAAEMLLDIGFRTLGLHRVTATCHPDNVGSWRVLEKAGMTREARMRDHKLARGTWRDSLLYSAIDPTA